MDRRFFKWLTDILDTERVLRSEPMSRHTSFRIGGPADFMVFPETVEEIAELLGLCKDEGIPVTVMGNGSNMLAADSGVDGVVINLAKRFKKISLDGDRIICQSGALLSTVSRFALRESLSGLEFAEGIPGTVGGAIAMNAGAYDGEMSLVTENVRCIGSDGKLLRFARGDHDFGYRKSRYQDRAADGEIICEAELVLTPGVREDIEAKMKDFAQRRRDKQPLEKPSAGSTFKRPAGGYAAKLIDDAGLRGLAVGDAQVSEKHCGFIVNNGNATAADVLSLMNTVRGRVNEQFGIELEPELKIVGRI